MLRNSFHRFIFLNSHAFHTKVSVTILKMRCQDLFMKSKRIGGIGLHLEFIISWDTQVVPRRIATSTLNSEKHPFLSEGPQ